MGATSVLGPAGNLMNLIGAAGLLSNDLYSLARGVRAAKRDIREFAYTLDMFSFASDCACACLFKHFSNDVGLVTVSKAKEKRFLKRVEESAKAILRRVEDITPRIISMEPSRIEPGLISKLRWYVRKSEVRDLMLGMSALQHSLSLVMSTVNYEVQIKQGASPETLAIAMAQITNFIKGGEVIAAKVEKLENTQHAADKTLHRLCSLLDNVIDVADHQLEVADTARDATGDYEPGRWVLKKQATPRVVFGKARRDPTETPAVFVNVSPTHLRKGKGRQIEREPLEAPSSMQPPGVIIGSENDRLTQPPDTRPLQEEALGYFTAPRPSDSYEEVNGYISSRIGRNSKSSSRTITARLYPNCRVNAISRAFAEQLRLAVTVLSGKSFVETPPAVGSTQAGPNRTVGEVKFVWHTPTHILRVTCMVFERDIAEGVPFVLGKPYVQQVETAGRVVRGGSSRAGEAW